MVHLVEADKNKKYAAHVETRLEGDIITHVGTKLPAEITRTDLIGLLQAVDERGARDIARRNLQIVRQIYEWGGGQRTPGPGHIESSGGNATPTHPQ